MSTTDSTNGAGGGAAVDVDEAFRNLVLDASLADAETINPVVERLQAHLGVDPVKASQCTEDYWGTMRHPVLQEGINAFLNASGREHEVVGVLCPVADPGFVLALSKLFTPASLNWPGATFGPATWEEISSGYRKTTRCLAQGLILIRDAEGPAAIWVSTSSPGPRFFVRHVTVTAPTPDRATSIIDELKRLGIKHSPYRGEMFIEAGGEGTQSLLFMPRPEPLGADNVILPPGLLERIDQHAVGVTRAAKRLGIGGQHLKRGLLLYGPPGTGKTHTIRYLVSQLPRETGILLCPAGRMGELSYLLPLMGDSAVVVLDDVDVIASDRSLPGIRIGLFHLLETLDGLHSHGDVLFVLTTNRLDALEPAVAARPGRIDEALEVPRPDADCRRRLFALYRKGMDLQMSDDEVEKLVERTAGVTAAFTKELLRRATVVAVENGATAGPDGTAPVTATDVFGALDEMLDPNNPATRLLLGADPDHVVQKVQIKVAGGDK